MAKAKGAKAMTKSQLMGAIAEDCDLSKKDVAAVFESMTKHIKKALGRSGPGEFVLPGLLKVQKKKVPAKPARKGVPNPFKPGETMDIPAKPATTKVKVRPLKGLKEMV